MTKRIVITPRASQDLDNYYTYITQNNPEAALRFFDATRQTFAKLAQMSGMGSFYPVKNSRLDGLQRFPIKGFENYLIFYLAGDCGDHNCDRIQKPCGALCFAFLECRRLYTPCI